MQFESTTCALRAMRTLRFPLEMARCAAAAGAHLLKSAFVRRRRARSIERRGPLDLTCLRYRSRNKPGRLRARPLLYGRWVNVWKRRCDAWSPVVRCLSFRRLGFAMLSPTYACAVQRWVSPRIKHVGREQRSDYRLERIWTVADRLRA